VLFLQKNVTDTKNVWVIIDVFENVAEPSSPQPHFNCSLRPPFVGQARGRGRCLILFEIHWVHWYHDRVPLSLSLSLSRSLRMRLQALLLMLC
jgi:hypothetical protein